MTTTPILGSDHILDVFAKGRAAAAKSERLAGERATVAHDAHLADLEALVASTAEQREARLATVRAILAATDLLHSAMPIANTLGVDADRDPEIAAYAEALRTEQRVLERISERLGGRASKVRSLRALSARTGVLGSPTMRRPDDVILMPFARNFSVVLSDVELWPAAEFMTFVGRTEWDGGIAEAFEKARRRHPQPDEFAMAFTGDERLDVRALVMKLNKYDATTPASTLAQRAAEFVNRTTSKPLLIAWRDARFEVGYRADPQDRDLRDAITARIARLGGTSTADEAFWGEPKGAA